MSKLQHLNKRMASINESLAPKQVNESNKDEAKKIIKRLQNSYPDFTNEDDIENILAQAEYKLDEGWTSDEVYQFHRNNEEVDPDKSEDSALAAMKKVTDAVKARLKK